MTSCVEQGEARNEAVTSCVEQGEARNEEASPTKIGKKSVRQKGKGMRGTLRSLFLAAAPLFLLCMSGCGGAKEPAPSGKLSVVATTGMIYDAVRIIGRDSVQATALMGPGVDPHLYKATHGDLEKLKNANLVLYNGLFLEGKMAEVLAEQARIKVVCAVAERIPKEQLRAHPHYENVYDPHVWFDVKLWKQAVQVVGEALQKQDARNSAFYAKNTQTYLLELDELDGWVRDTLQNIKSEHRRLITAHDAFGYFGQAYGIEVRGLQGLSTVAEFGLRDVAELVQYAVEHRIPAVFIETSVSDKALRAVLEGANAKGHNLRIGGSLYSDAMGAFGTPDGTYIGMVRANVRTIVRALTQK